MHVSSSELLEYTKGVLCTASWRYTTPPCTPRHSLTKFHEGLHLSKTLGRVRSIVNYDKTYGIFLRGFANICAVSNTVDSISYVLFFV